MKTGILYTLLLFGVVAVLRFSTHPPMFIMKEHRRHGPGRRLVLRTHSLRSASQHEHVAFDPLVAEFERKNEEHALERQKSAMEHHAPGMESQPDPWSDDYGNFEEYMNDEERFNISQRLTILFPLMDTNPFDNFVSLKELQDWHVQLALKDALYRANRELQTLDTNEDGLVSFKEYLPSLSGEDIENVTKEHGGTLWWKEYFDIADEDEDKLLNQVEFFNFLHPEDGNNTKLHHWSRKQEIKTRDTDEDGKLSFLEFEQNLFDFFRDHDAHSANPVDDGKQISREELAKAKFAELDSNTDGFLTDDEFGPVMDKLQPGETYYAKQQAKDLIEEADKDKDGHLSLKEMLQQPYIFYSTAYSPNDDTNMFHDEF